MYGLQCLRALCDSAVKYDFMGFYQTWLLKKQLKSGKVTIHYVCYD